MTLTSNDADFDAVPGASVTFTASGTCTGTAQYRFYSQAPGASGWTLERDWAAGSSFTWDTTGLALGAWRIQVQVRDVSTGNAQTYVTKAFNLASSAPCSSVSATPSPAEVVAGGTATITSVAATCSNPEYQIYHKPPGGTYAALGAFAPGNSTINWDSTGEPNGVHAFQVRVRRQGSMKTYEAYSQTTVAVTGSTPCTGLSLAPSPTSPQASGTQITLTATATGCSSAEYRFFYRPPGGSYTELRAYASGNSTVWNTTGRTAGVYNLQVWARAPGSSASYQKYAGITYTLTGGSTPPPMSKLAGGGWNHNCRLEADGVIGCWGYSAHGEVGSGSTANKVVVPTQVTGITNGAAIASGYAFSCAALATGAVRCWGDNTRGQLGDGTKTQANTPVNVSGLTTAASVAAGNSHSCAVLADGTARCWGNDTYGQLGDGGGSDKTAPVTAAGVTGVSKLTAGTSHTCALLTDQTVRCWGRNNVGQLGNGTNTNSMTPVTVSGLTGVVSLNTYANNNCAVRSNGTIWCWGQNSAYGTLGDGSTVSRNAPVQVTGVTTAANVALGFQHACATLQNGTATCWGYNAFGQLGNASTANSLTPVAVSGLTTVTSVSTSYYSTCANLADDTARCWGYGALGTLGNGGSVNSNVPVVVTPLP